jgi:uncharacterized membrane protein YccC
MLHRIAALLLLQFVADAAQEARSAARLEELTELLAMSVHVLEYALARSVHAPESTLSRSVHALEFTGSRDHEAPPGLARRQRVLRLHDPAAVWGHR